MEAQLMRVEEAARCLSLGRSKTYQLVADGELPSVRIGRSVRVPIEGLREWVRHRTVAATAALECEHAADA